MLKSIMSRFKEIPKPSAYIIKFGMIFCTMAMIIITLVFIHSSAPDTYSYTALFLCRTAAVTIVYVFAEVIIGALSMDCYAKRHGM